MAEEEEKKPEEGQEEQEAVQKKGLPINIIIISILVVGLLIGGYFAWKGGIFSRSSGIESVESSDNEDTKHDIGPIYSLETFIVNLVGGSGKSYLKAKLDLEMNNEDLRSEIDRRLPQFRDSILTMLSNKSHNDVKSLEGKFQLRAEIISTLNQHLKTGKIRNIYFTDFIVQ